VSGTNADLCREIKEGCEINVWVSAGSARSGVSALHGNALKVAVRAAPEKGKANAELERVLAAFFGVSRGKVRVVSGQTSRRKRVRLEGLSVGAVRAALDRAGLG